MPNVFGAVRPGLLLLSIGAAFALTTSTAAASPPPASALCKGKTTAVKGDSTQVSYAFHCNQNIKSYSIVSSVSVAGFDVNVSVFLPSGAIDTNDAWGCEGDIPGDGFHCNGTAAFGAITKGQYEPESDKPCSAKGKWIPKAWLVVADTTGEVEGPFRLVGPKTCKAPKPAKKAKKSATHKS
jgi:hypothetical protein